MLAIDERHEIEVRGHSVTWWLADSDRHFFRVEVVTPGGRFYSGTIASQDSLSLGLEGEPPLHPDISAEIEKDLWSETDRLASEQ